MAPALRHWSSWFPPRLDWLQVEITTNCPAACVYCPRTVYRRFWQRRHMSLATFRLLSGLFDKIGMVYLQGWGEPLSHPRLFEMVRMAKEAGCRVGMTTNGMAMGEETCARLVREGVDAVAFSLAGTDERGDAVRRGTLFSQTTNAIRTLERTKTLMASTRPTVHLAYLLLQSHWQQVQALPALMLRLNVRHAVISTLDFVTAPALAAEAILPATREAYETMRAELEQVAKVGGRARLSIHYWLASPPETEEDKPACYSGAAVGLPWLVAPSPTCTENIQRAAFIGADGSVAPCVYAAVPVAGATHLVGGTERSYARLAFGNIRDTPFERIWRSGPYAAFRAAHRRGKLPERCRDCPRPRMLQTG